MLDISNFHIRNADKVAIEVNPTGAKHIFINSDIFSSSIIIRNNRYSNIISINITIA
jgi:hypothetical protein